jgi:hypothetical protein
VTGNPSRPNEAPFVAVALLAGVATLNWAVTLPGGPARAAIVLPLALLLPGGALAAALPGRVRDPLVALAIVPLLSVSFYAFGSLALAAANVELTRTSVVLAVDAFVAGCALVLVLRGEYEGLPPFRALRAVSPTAVAVVALAACVFVLATVTAPRVFPAERARASTRLAFAGEWARVAAAQPLPRRRLAVRLSLENHEGQPVRYRIAARLGGARWPVRKLTLRDGATWSGALAGAVRTRPCRQRLLVELTRPRLHRPPLSLALEFTSRARGCRNGGGS